MGDHAGDLVGQPRVIDLGDVVEREVDLFVVIVELGTGGVGDAGEGAEDEGHGACRGRRRVRLRGFQIQQAQDVADGGLQCRRGVDGRQEVESAVVGEIANLQTKLWQTKVASVCLPGARRWLGLLGSMDDGWGHGRGGGENSGGVWGGFGGLGRWTLRFTGHVLLRKGTCQGHLWKRSLRSADGLEMKTCYD